MENAEIKIGSVVEKKSGKPFQNGMKEAIITSFGEMVIPLNHTLDGTKIVPCVYLNDCRDPVRQDILTVIRY